MKINVSVNNLKVLAKESTKSQDGQNTYYKLAVLSGVEAGNISCSKDVYDLVAPDKLYDIAGIYNTEYKSLKLEIVTREIK